MFKKLKITCDEATTICDKNQYGEATLGEKITLLLHFLKCNICSKYSKQNTLLTKIYKSKAKAAQTNNHSLCMSNKEKENLRKEFENLSV